MGLDGVDACGLEALLHWTRLASDRGLRVTLGTSAELLSQAGAAEQLARAGAQRLEVPVYGSTAPMHDFHTATPGSFRRTLLGVRAARAAGLEVIVTSILTRSNYRHITELVRLCAAVGVRTLRVAEVEALCFLEAPDSPEAPSWIAPRALLARQLRLGAEVAHGLGLHLEVDRAPRVEAHRVFLEARACLEAQACSEAQLKAASSEGVQSKSAPSSSGASASFLPASGRVLEVPVRGSGDAQGLAAHAVGSIPAESSVAP